LDNERNDGRPPEDDVETYTLDDIKAIVGLELYEQAEAI
jgi:hypothetical protein